MYTSDDPQGRQTALRLAARYLAVSLFCAFFGAVYEAFSHGVYSYFMLYAFAFPLVGGTAVFLALARGRGRMPSAPVRQLYHGGVASLTLGSLMRGVLEIYGTTNALVSAYWYAGGALCLTAVLLCAAGSRRRP